MHLKTLLKKLDQDNNENDLRTWAFSVSNSTLYRLHKIYYDNYSRPLITKNKSVFRIEIETNNNIFVALIDIVNNMIIDVYSLRL